MPSQTMRRRLDATVAAATTVQAAMVAEASSDKALPDRRLSADGGDMVRRRRRHAFGPRDVQAAGGGGGAAAASADEPSLKRQRQQVHLPTETAAPILAQLGTRRPAAAGATARLPAEVAAASPAGVAVGGSSSSVAAGTSAGSTATLVRALGAAPSSGPPSGLRLRARRGRVTTRVVLQRRVLAADLGPATAADVPEGSELAALIEVVDDEEEDNEEVAPGPLRMRRRRRRHGEQAASAAEAPRTGPSPPAGPPPPPLPRVAPPRGRPSAAKSAPTALPASLRLSASSSSAAEVPEASPDGSLSTSELRDLKDAVWLHVRKRISCAAEEAQVLTDFIMELVASQRSEADLVKELEMLEGQAVSVAAWVEEQKTIIVARRFRTPDPQPVAQHGAAAEPPPGNLSPLSVRVPRGSPRQGGDYVVITPKLVLQPKPGLLSRAHESKPQSATQQPVVLAQELSLELLTKYTQTLHEILMKSANPAISGQSREKYEGMAQSIRAKMEDLRATVRR